MLRAALHALWPEGTPQRGMVRVFFPEENTAGTTGAQAAIVTLVTGARGDDGFKGIAGRFDRRNLLFFDTPLTGGIGFQRKDNDRRVIAAFDSSIVPPQPKMRLLLQKWAENMATEDETAEFGRLWQERVRAILLDHADDPELVRVSLWQ